MAILRPLAYATCATNAGLSQQHSFMPSAVITIPRRAFAGSGETWKGQASSPA